MFKLNNLNSVITSQSVSGSQQNYRCLWFLPLIFVGVLSPLPWKNHWAYAQQASDLLHTDEFSIRPTVNDSVFQLAQEAPEPSKSTTKSDRSGWALTAVVGTLGVGGNLSRSLIRDRLNLRGGFSSVVFGGDITTRDTRYGTDLRLSGGIPLVLDFFPAKNWFRVSGGLVINRNRLELSANALDEGETIEIGGEIFESDLVGDLDGNIEYNEVAPYIGIGIGNPVGRGTKFSFFLELGAMFQGSGDISLNASGSLANDPEFLEALDEEIGDIDDETTFSDLPVYPILQLGFSYQF
ncbi:MAG: hypothetical protein QNJ55_09450 [Xenococcus sp. MO_188.B8]|nr:hypothetical protein [Xenococcus sp. MO_188.B8]